MNKKTMIAQPWMYRTKFSFRLDFISQYEVNWNQKKFMDTAYKKEPNFVYKTSDGEKTELHNISNIEVADFIKIG